MPKSKKEKEYIVTISQPDTDENNQQCIKQAAKILLDYIYNQRKTNPNYPFSLKQQVNP